jgi:hypothetical protein
LGERKTFSTVDGDIDDMLPAAQVGGNRIRHPRVVLNKQNTHVITMIRAEEEDILRQSDRSLAWYGNR